MKKVEIKYNPYVVETEITVDGQKPKANSALNVGKKRIQEWVDKLPQILLDEYRDSNFTVEYTGTKSDYDDVEQSFNSYKDKVSATFNFHKTADITDIERTIDKLFEEIKNGPVAELKDKKIIQAFEKAKDSKFEINVVATMSSGKSTLINALLCQQLMPAAMEATTATIVKIVDTEQDHFSAIAYDKSGQIVKKLDNVTLEDMQELNANIKVSTIEIKGKIPFVSSVGMKLVLVDTPGPNNSRDKSHEEMTYKMIADSDKSLVLYVMNGQQLGINDEKIFLDYVCQSMKDGGKKARARFIFAVNKMDDFSPDPHDDGPDCITKALDNVKSGLEDREIYNPNIFPVCSLPALQKRAEMKGTRARALKGFVDMCEEYDVMHFENYYEYNNLPLTVRNRIENFKAQSTDANETIEIHTGIVSIEQAIAQYINKYARTTKVYDLVQSFNEKLNELAAVAHLEDAIRKDENAKAEIDKQIQRIKETIESAKNAQMRSKNIHSIDLVTSVNKRLEEYFSTINTQISKMISGETKVEKTKALNQCEQIEKQCKAIALQIKVQIEKIIQDAYKTSINKVVEEYKKYLADLNLNVNSSALAFSPISLVSASLADLSSIVKDNTQIVDESYEVDEEYKVKIKGTKGRNAAGGAAGGAAAGAAIGSFIPGIGTLIGGIAGALFGAAGGAISGESEHYETRTRKKLIKKEGQYLDMRSISREYTQEFQESVINVKDQTTDFVTKETARLKDHLKEELKKIDEVLKKKLDSLSKVEADSKIKAEELAQKQANLKWLEDIQDRVTNIINF